jgi:hypothetical protein
MTMYDSGYLLPAAGLITSALDSVATGDGPPFGLLGRMRANHSAQWDAEDGCRALTVHIAELGRLKRRIDELNAVRTELIDQVDAWVAHHVDQSPTALLHTETYGALLDRIVISWLRKTRVQSLDAKSQQATSAGIQHMELLNSYDVLIQGVRSGSRKFPDWRSLKLYGLQKADRSG